MFNWDVIDSDLNVFDVRFDSEYLIESSPAISNTSLLRVIDMGHVFYFGILERVKFSKLEGSCNWDF